MTTIRSTLMAALAILWLLSAAPVAADCELPGPIQEELARAPIAFVGAVVDVEGSRATLEVSEVWAGEIPPVVEVYGLFGPEGEKGGRLPGIVVLPNTISEDDRTWQVGETYLVLPYVDGGSLHDNICTATTVWEPELEALRPEGARAPTEQADGGGPLILVLAAVALVAAGSILAFRRR